MPARSAFLLVVKEAMDLSLREVAKLLDVTEDTVYRWVRAGKLPFHRVHDQYRFNRVELQEWATANQHPVSPDLFATRGSAAESNSLLPAIHRGGVFYDVPGDQPQKVLEAVTHLPGIPASVNRPLLLELLLSREALASTGVGDGIAFPHPRDPLVVSINEPYVLLCFLKQPVDFGALDTLPVRILFTLLSPSVRVHLQILAKLAFLLHDHTLKTLLQSQASKDAIVDRIQTLEQAGRPAMTTVVKGK